MKEIFRNIVVAIITLEAKLVLHKYKPRVIAITGNVGKTSTKDAIFSALEGTLYVRKSKKSLNSEIGVPLTILGCESGWTNPLKWTRNIIEGFALVVFPNHYPKWLVLEVGTDRPHDIEEITTWLKPDVVVVTALPDIPVHVENFSRPEDVATEKKKLVKALKEDGTLVLAGDDKRVHALAKEYSKRETVLYGTELHNAVAGTHVEIAMEHDRPTGMQFRVVQNGHESDMFVEGRLGQQQIYPALAGLAVAQVVGVDFAKAKKGIEDAHASPGRMRLLLGHNGTTIIDDTYNSSPIALRAALATLKKVPTSGRRIAVLGDMLELGRFSPEAHKKAGVQVAGVADVLITVGVRAKEIADSARASGFDVECIQEFDTDDAQRAGNTVRAMLEPGDVVLVKGSQGIRLERTVKEILENPRQAKKLLVRQEDAWQER